MHLETSALTPLPFPPAQPHFINHTQPTIPNRSNERLTLETSALESLQRPIYVINSVNKTKYH